MLGFSKLKEFPDDNLEFDENDRKLPIWVENTDGKVEIARYEQFLLFPQCFQKTHKNQCLFGELLRNKLHSTVVYYNLKSQ